MLSTASPVFKTLFGPHFREGQEPRTAASPVEIALPDDDFTAMKMVCVSLHFLLVYPVVRPPMAAKLLAFAITADKYALLDALHAQAGNYLYTWLDRNSTSAEPASLCNIIAASWVLGHIRAFYLATQQLIRTSHIVSLIPLHDQASLTLVPPITLGTKDD